MTTELLQYIVTTIGNDATLSSYSGPHFVMGPDGDGPGAAPTDSQFPIITIAEIDEDRSLRFGGPFRMLSVVSITIYQKETSLAGINAIKSAFSRKKATLVSGILLNSEIIRETPLLYVGQDGDSDRNSDAVYMSRVVFEFNVQDSY